MNDDDQSGYYGPAAKAPEMQVKTKMEGGAVRMKRLTIMILATLVILALAGCGGDDGTAGSAGSTSDTATKVDSSTSDAAQGGADDAEQNKETAQSHDSVPDPDVPVYPNAEEVYNDKGTIFYVTTDSGEKVSKFYEGHSYLNEGKKARNMGEGFYEYRTPLVELVLAVSRGYTARDSADENPQEEIGEMNAYIDEFGGLSSVLILDVSADSQIREQMIEHYSSDIPLDKTLIMFGFQDKL
ncbi:MAG: hypothetical protein GX604_02540 [Actinobacteria bacterium]|nr:hypothetical protein [Actinomycetota bacterium]